MDFQKLKLLYTFCKSFENYYHQTPYFHASSCNSNVIGSRFPFQPLFGPRSFRSFNPFIMSTSDSFPIHLLFTSVLHSSFEYIATQATHGSMKAILVILVLLLLRVSPAHLTAPLSPQPPHQVHQHLDVDNSQLLIPQKKYNEASPISALNILHLTSTLIPLSELSILTKLEKQKFFNLAFFYSYEIYNLSLLQHDSPRPH